MNRGSGSGSRRRRSRFVDLTTAAAGTPMQPRTSMTINPHDTCRRTTSATEAIVRTHRHGQGIPLEDMCRPGGGAGGLPAVMDAAQTSRATRRNECSGRSSGAPSSSCLTLMRPATPASSRTGRLQRRAAACPCGSARDRRQRALPHGGRRGT